ncbi:MAG: hypothetical protein OEN50_16865 [Deltaproteobacteria bacterium]|nr:hypothetical protein [Deltaproteobacteria bacterium]
MKMAKTWAMTGLVLFILAFGARTSAYDSKGMFMAYGPGNEPCSEFDALRDRRLENLTSKQQDMVEDTVEYWLSGFYTAWNYFSGETFDVSGGIKYDAVMEQVEKYCERHPKKKLVDAAIVVGHALHSTRTKAAPQNK